jgi:hypothetical protein
MRNFLSDSEAAKILGKRRTQLYRIVDLFDADPNDEWELEEGVHFEFAGTEVPGTQGQRPRRLTILQLIPRNELNQLDPAIVTKEFAPKSRKKFSNES